MTWFSIEMWLVALAVTIMLIGGFSTFVRWVTNSPAVPRRKLEALHVGMTADQTRALLGAPTETRPGEDEHEFWVYSSRFKRHRLAIEFNPAGTLVGFAQSAPRPKKPKDPE